MKTVPMWLTHNLGVLPQLMKMVIWYQMIGDIVPQLAQLCDTVLAEQVNYSPTFPADFLIPIFFFQFELYLFYYIRSERPQGTS